MPNGCFNRLKEGYVLVRNPVNIHQISKINLSPDVVDGIVFWTKNPVPMPSRLSELDRYNYYFQFTLNAYDRDVEPNICITIQVSIYPCISWSETDGSRYFPFLICCRRPFAAWIVLLCNWKPAPPASWSTRSGVLIPVTLFSSTPSLFHVCRNCCNFYELFLWF